MKKTLLFAFTITLSFLVLSCGDSNKDNSDISKKDGSSDLQKRYGIKSAVVEYIITGSQEGTKTLYFDNWGMRQAEYTRSVLSVGGFSKPINIVNIIDGDYQYMINIDQNSGTKTRNPILRSMDELKGQKGFNEFGEQMLLSMGANKIGKEEFLGKDCDIYDMRNTGTKLWVWKWITLKSETNSRGLEINVTATRINEGAVPKDKFKIPDNVTLNEVDLDNIEKEMREENK
ncbi:MAG TPA: hypothetical protein PK073_00530 [Ignavibacteriaceae bacterium]|jgi:hypothetical protein|nr:MAG: hypothetical protein BWY38_02095 [Ignavibacteria bacterium ADurb.Bin266]OQY73012.1 MAG: hypothetical protein B6D44_08510 [Ignavibacteriales bacterium UTCHB2]HQF41363.1 hypothetical protein [Ignavibacteriaceae bacterium]HQI41116.1 hypothetical protein [Ignavibacteriaceae bacterium]